MRAAVPALLTLALWAALAPAQESSYAAWPKGPPGDPGFFPIGVWLQAPQRAPQYKALGINTYVGLWKGPTEEQLAELARHGMKVACDQNEVALAHLDDPTIIAWLHEDEPDNARRIGSYWKSAEQIREAWPEEAPRPLESWGTWGPPVSPRTIAKRYREMRRRDPSRPVLLNLGMGVAFDAYKGRRRSNHPEDYPRYIEGADIVSFDIYPRASGVDGVQGQLHLVPFGVERLRGWCSKKQVVWNVVECTPIHAADRKASPRDVRAEVWMSLIAGSRGIVYFAHVIAPKFCETGLLQDREMMRAVKAINMEIRRLAPVLNAPSVPRALEVASSNPEVPVAAVLKRHEGATWIFAVALRDGRTQVRFRLRGPAGRGAEVEVLGEERRIAAKQGAFSDEFGPYEVHLYRL